MSALHILASVFGYMGALVLFIQVVFGNRLFFSFFTKDTVVVNKFHKQLGIYGTLLIFMHPLLEMMWQNSSFLWIFIPNFSIESEQYISFGRFALYLLLIVWITSAFARQKIKWRPWKYIHLLAYPLIVLTFIHALDLGQFYNDYLVVRIVWGSMFALFLVSTFWRMLVWVGVGKKQTTIISKSMQGETIFLLTVSVPEGAEMSRIGQHVYLQLTRCGSEHPFTVMDVNQKKKELMFGMRTGGKFVEEIKSLDIGATLLLDGPYGTFTTEAWNESEKVIIAGGIGVTPFIRLAREYGKNSSFLYCNRTVGEALARDTIKKEVSRYFDIVDVHEGSAEEGVIVGKLDAELLQKILGEKITIPPYFICGSPLFISIMKKTLLSLGIKKKNIFYEELGF